MAANPKTEQHAEQPAATQANAPGGQQSAPTISLPKGGGAIRGMGEKFAVNPATGTSSLSVPIFTSPGRSDFFPKLSLAYDSGASNGPFGLGWNLGIPSVTRKTDKGLPRYRDADESDTFILSDAEDLVPCLRKVDDEWQRETATQTAFDKQWDVHRYRPRIEGLFARIEHWRAQDGNESHWRVITKENVTSLYGRTPAARIADPDEPSHIFRWLLEQSYDDKGNVILYEYKSETSDGINLASVEEKNRTDSSRSANRYVKRIKYCNKKPHRPGSTPFEIVFENGPTDWLLELVFDHGEHYEELPADDQGREFARATNVEDPARKWPVRQDAFSTHRAGFEIRTYRLCRRVLMFHHFPDEPEVGANCLVRSTDFVYNESPVASFISSVTQSGYRRETATNTYFKRSLPPLEFNYSEVKIDDQVRTVDPESFENMPYGVEGSHYQWVDLDGDGLSGVLTQQGNAWYYKRNLSPINRADGRVATFAPVERVSATPTIPLAQAQFMDLAGDGRIDLVTLAHPGPGFYERTENEDWEIFRPFTSWPNVETRDPNLKFIDLDGDGHSDILVSEDEVFRWYPSLAEDGFGPAEFVSQTTDEEKGPRLVFADAAQSIYLADFSGDGLTDLVRIRNGEVCYWPNVGYGRFGAKVTMDHSPVFDAPDQFDQRRIRLGDIDGSGTTDIFYLRKDSIGIWYNRSGNSWSDEQRLDTLPPINNLTSVAVVDLLGNGTACLVWSSSAPADAHEPMRYIDLMGGQKPHLLTRVVNNLGAETRVEYASSTKFYVEARLAGRPWVTRLPFPVQVVERVKTYDHVSRNRFVTRYAYHHGYFDGEEREFRGFGRVDQWDTEQFAALTADDTLPPDSNTDAASHVPPVRTVTWFHTGAYFEDERISQHLAHEYYGAPRNSEPDFSTKWQEFEASLLPDTILPTQLVNHDGSRPAFTLTAKEEREACRSLKGSILRQEIYAEDNSAKAQMPYSVSERNFTIECLQIAEADNRHGVFFTHTRETLDYHYERALNDPRVSHQLILRVDAFGNVERSVNVAYPRANVTERHPEQEQTNITLTLRRFANRDDSPAWYRAGLSVESSTYEVVKPPAPGLRFQFELLRQLVEELVPSDRSEPTEEKTTPYEIWDWRKRWDPNIEPGGRTTSTLRLIERVRTSYYRNDLSGPLPLGEVESLAIPYEEYKESLTRGLITQVFEERITDDLLREGGYVAADGVWWIPAGRHSHDAAHFFLPITFRDPFGSVTTFAYDQYQLLLTQTTDALSNVVTARHNYRTLSPYVVTDPNGNRTAVRFDELGMVTATAVLGKPNQGEGDVLDLRSTEATSSDDPTTRIEYSLFEWMLKNQANFVHTFVRERHGAANPRWQESYSYSDGNSHEIMKKIQAEPGLAPSRDSEGALRRNSDGTLLLQDTTPQLRWVGTGRTVFDNKGNPIKKYEPFFSSSPEYESETDLVQWGVTPIFHYDALGRLIRTDHPNGTFSKVEFDAWQQVTWDENDTVLESRWYAERSALPAGDPDRRAADLSALHSGTPGVVHLDPLSRQFLNVVDNGHAGKYVNRFERDIEGNQRLVTDARNNAVAQQSFDMLGHKIYARSSDAGASRTLLDVGGNPIRSWDSRNRVVRKVYDALRRSTHLFVREGERAEQLLERTVYGESHPRAAQLNLRLALYQEYDGAGVVTNEVYDFKGNTLRTNRRLAIEYRADVDWAAADQIDITTASGSLLESESFTTLTEYDALNRPFSIITPDGSETTLTYNPSNVLESSSVRLRGVAPATVFVRNIDYNAKGQRERIDYGNGIRTEYEYDRATFRLVRILSTRPSGANPVQDLSFFYDPVGNIVEISDDAQQTIFFNNAVVTPSGRYEYDALYRLTRAEGREHTSLPVPQQTDHTSPPLMNLPHANDLQALQRYSETYEYDSVGNILRVIHLSNSGSWTRRYEYAPDSNRLRAISLPADSESGPFSGIFGYDEHGNMTRMPHLANLSWDLEDQLQHVDLGGGGNAYYVQDAHGQRVRKVIERIGSSVEERIYLSGYETYRRRVAGALVQEIQTLHITDSHHRIALSETIIRNNGNDVASPASLIRYQLSNHLGSACLELDDTAALISYEEYYPFGSTSYHSGRGVAEVSLKRYRYTGKEHDEETGFYYHGARYYAPWLGRWTSCDPAGLTDGSNVYSYVNNRPLALSDPTGLWGWREVAVIAAVVVVGTVVTVATAGAAGPLVVGAVASVGLTGTAATVATGVAVGAISGAVAGAAAGAAGEATRQTVHSRALGLGTESFSGGRIARAAGRGAVEGAAIGAAVGGVAALATTAAGGAAVAAVGRVGQRVVPAALRQGAGAVGRGIAGAGRSLARLPGARQALQVGGRGVEAVGRNLARLEVAAARRGVQAARGLYAQGSAASEAVETFNRSFSVARTFGAARPRATAPLPQGVTQEQFEALSNTVRSRAGALGDDIVVQGSRASGTAAPTSDLDIAIRVSPEKFDEVLANSFGTPNPGSARLRTMQHAAETGKIQAGEVRLPGGGRLSAVRKEVEAQLGREVDISVVRQQGRFDQGPFVDLR